MLGLVVELGLTETLTRGATTLRERSPLGQELAETCLLRAPGPERFCAQARWVETEASLDDLGFGPRGAELGFYRGQVEQRLFGAADALAQSRDRFLADSEQLHADDGGAQSLTLLEAMRAALDSNPALAASVARAGSAADDVGIARSNLLPSLSASATRTRIDADRANPLLQAEDTTSAGLSFSQVVYSERAWAGYSIAKSLAAAAAQGQRADMLDTLNDAASAYLNLLRAKSVESVRKRNVENTRRNLETSRVREEVGLGGRSDYLRWVAQLARDKQSLLSAESQRRQAETEVLRILHRPATPGIDAAESGLDDPLGLVSSKRTQSFLDTPAKWAVFMEYAVATALENAPEIARARAVVDARERALASAHRSYYLPDLALVTSASRIIRRSSSSSAGSRPSPLRAGAASAGRKERIKAAPTAPWALSTAARSIRLRSSRTLPGQP